LLFAQNFPVADDRDRSDPPGSFYRYRTRHAGMVIAEIDC
jgi:hypothetical protein